MELFKNKDLVFIPYESKLSKDQIMVLVKSGGKALDSFVDLYQTYNGVNFPRGAMMFVSDFYPVKKGQWDKIEIEYFLTYENIKEIQDIKIQDNALTYELAQSHVAFADDGCGNTIWMELSTGIIKVFYHEYELDQGLINIAPSLVDFCNSLQNWTLK